MKVYHKYNSLGDLFQIVNIEEKQYQEDGSELCIEPSVLEIIKKLLEIEIAISPSNMGWEYVAVLMDDGLEIRFTENIEGLCQTGDFGEPVGKISKSFNGLTRKTLNGFISREINYHWSNRAVVSVSELAVIRDYNYGKD